MADVSPAAGGVGTVGAAAGTAPGARKRDQTPPPRQPPKEGASGSQEPSQSSAAAQGKPGTEEAKEFGGPVGALCIIVGSHVLMFLMARSLYGGSWDVFIPTIKSVAWFLVYHASQNVFALIMPGVWVKGLSELGYLCNGYSTLYATVGGALLLHWAELFDLTELVKNYPAYLTTAIILGDIYSVITHFAYARAGERWSIYNFFIGVETHPRIGKVDVKMVAETRVSWTLLFLVTLGSYLETSRRLGTWLNPTAFMLLAHGLYANACAKGEHFIPYTWDISTEKFGWMLCWWNLAGVPLLYCYQSLFLAKSTWEGLLLPPVPKEVYYGVLVVALLLAYWIWDEANYHKCYFKMEQRGEILNRRLFPTFRHVKDPKYIKCDAGVLLIDGWYAYARKIHYTADTVMALLWGLSCGFSSLLPYFYFVFFVAMITHRAGRDEARCRAKYGAAWDKYLKAVPYRFVPRIY
uniref:Delta(24(24(1)))-sterol reductase n=1 Tax=Alexandrium monilatum TaxID=311494 RepID=A0A7S4PV59_9DINO|mmetsp:Transcript_42492/g.133810  ORF Transcript_42492/g.133810 Transcript_42492/m.133810 type:complete len:465 (+) Transcript_42492:3-1397(+)